TSPLLCLSLLIGACGSTTAHTVGSSEPSAPTGGASVDSGDAAPQGTGTDGFVHPGLLVTRGMLDFVKAKIAAGAEPWTGALAKAAASKLGNLAYVPHPIADVDCGSYSNPDIGCTDEKNDADAAYTHALLWYHTGNPSHADKAIEIMNAWASTVEQHTNSNAPLQSAWVAEVFPRAGEIIRATYPGWTAAETGKFAAMLAKVYLPQVIAGSKSNGNWELSMIEAVMNIGVFTDDPATFQTGVSMWRKRTPAYLYLTGDGPTPVPPPTGTITGSKLSAYWYDQTQLVDGVCQETCRDLGHVQYGLAAMVNAAETARIQGVDLFSEEETRLQAGLEFHAGLLNGGVVPAWLCGGTLAAVTPAPMWEIAYNAFANGLGQPMPETKRLVQTIRPTASDHHMVWETLTHAEVGTAGLPGL
ncbi:MAG TPA: alginate lyase family protein, partial [Polyangia bacterium]